MNATA